MTETMRGEWLDEHQPPPLDGDLYGDQLDNVVRSMEGGAMPAIVLVQVYKTALARPSQRWRWRAKGLNHRKLANGGEGYSTKAKLVHALHLLWPDRAGDHVAVMLPGSNSAVWLGTL